ncbi:MAG: acetyl-CoA hydrolase/transferase family protein [Anaerovoracaceae bacterium]
MKESLINEFRSRETTIEEAVKIVKNGDVVNVGSFSGISTVLLNALGEREDITDITITGSNFVKPTPLFDQPERCHVYTSFLGAEDRRILPSGILDYTCVHLSQVDIWCRETCPPTVLFLEVSSPDEEGYMSLGTSSIACGKYLMEKADRIVLQINSKMPYVLGEDNKIHITQADKIIYHDEDILELPPFPTTPEVEQISKFLIEQIPDGACVQIGIGNIGNAVAYGLKDKNDLGIHTEMLTESLVYLVENGNVTNARKAFKPGMTVSSFALGSKHMYEFLDHNEKMHFMPFPVVNDPFIISQNDNMISINSALQINLFGEVVSDNMNGIQYSGCGGQLDFVRGAQRSKGGKSFIAIPSVNVSHRTGKVTSRIVSHFEPYTAVTTPRADTQYVATEYGCVNLKPLPMRDRVHAMISLAHPDFRAELIEDAKKAGIY